MSTIAQLLRLTSNTLKPSEHPRLHNGKTKSLFSAGHTTSPALGSSGAPVARMREIVHIQGGQCGNQIGAKFWEVGALNGCRFSAQALQLTGQPLRWCAACAGNLRRAWRGPRWILPGQPPCSKDILRWSRLPDTVHARCPRRPFQCDCIDALACRGTATCSWSG